jgi:nucleotide-binding universal stress UspA family protein
MTTLAPAKITFERILIPIDFSDVSWKTVEYAKDIAKDHRSRLLLVHVEQPMNLLTPPEAMWIDDEGMRQRWEQQLEQRGAELRSEGFQAEALSVTGSVRNIDLIVMATHGRIGLDRLLFGSEAEAVLRHTQCPVLVLGPAASTVPNQAWPPRHVLCATTLDPDAAWIAAYAFQLAYEHRAQFMIFNVEDSLSLNKAEDWSRFENAFRKSLPNGMSPSAPLHMLLGDVPGYRIVDLAKERRSDLIVMGAHATSAAATHLVRGTVPQVFTDAPCPVLTLHWK